MSQLEICEKIARELHEGQTRRDGRPYITHCERVAAACGDAEPAACVAWLHDVIEDGHCDRAYLLKNGVARDVVNHVHRMTHRSGDSYLEYIMQIVWTQTSIAVKILDIIDNLTDKPSDRQKEKYTKALLYLAGIR